MGGASVRRLDHARRPIHHALMLFAAHGHTRPVGPPESFDLCLRQRPRGKRNGRLAGLRQ